MKKGDTRIDQVNAALAKISSEDQVKLMDDMIKKQPASSDASDDKQTFFSQMMKILKDNTHWRTKNDVTWFVPEVMVGEPVKHLN